MSPSDADKIKQANFMEEKKKEFQQIRKLISNASGEIDKNDPAITAVTTTQQVKQLYTGVLDILKENKTITNEEYQKHINSSKIFEEINATSNLMKLDSKNINTEDRLIVSVDNWLQKTNIDSGVMGGVDENKKQIIQETHHQIMLSPKDNISNNILEAIKINKDPESKIQEMLKSTKAEDRELVVFETLKKLNKDIMGSTTREIPDGQEGARGKKEIEEINNPSIVKTLIDISPLGAKKYIEYINDPKNIEAQDIKKNQEAGATLTLLTPTYKYGSEERVDTLFPGAMPNSEVRIDKLTIPKYIEKYYEQAHSQQKISGSIGIKSADEIAETITQHISSFAQKNLGKKVDEKMVTKLFQDNLNILEKNDNISNTEKISMMKDKNFTKEVSKTTKLLNVNISEISFTEKAKIKVSNFLSKFESTKTIAGKIQSKLSPDTIRKVNKLESQLANVVTSSSIFASGTNLKKSGVLSNIKSNISQNKNKKEL